MRRSYSASIAVVLLAVVTSPSVTYGETVVNAGVLEAPYRGTITGLRESQIDIPYGEVWNYMTEMNVSSINQAGGNIRISCEGFDEGFSRWDKSVLRLYWGADASGQEIDLSTPREVAPDVIAQDGVVGRLSFRAMGTRTLSPVKYKIRISYSTWGGSFFHSHTLGGVDWIQCSQCIDGVAWCAECMYGVACNRCSTKVEEVIIISVEPLETAYPDEYFSGEASATRIVCGTLDLTVPISKRADLIGTCSLRVVDSVGGSTANAEVELPWSGEAFYIPSKEQFEKSSGDYAKIYFGFGTPWPGHMRGWVWISGQPLTVIDPSGRSYVFDQWDNTRRVWLLGRSYPLGATATSPSATVYEYSNNRLTTIRNGINSINLNHGTSGQVDITTSSGAQNCAVKYDPATNLITGVVPSDPDVAPTYFSWRKKSNGQLISVADGGRVTQVRTHETPDQQVLYSFQYCETEDGCQITDYGGTVPYGELLTESENINGTMTVVAKHENDPSKDFSILKEYVAPEQWNEHRFSYGAVVDGKWTLGSMLTSVTSYKALNGQQEDGEYKTEYQWDICPPGVAFVPAVVATNQEGQLHAVKLPDGSVVEHTHNSCGLRVKTVTKASVNAGADQTLCTYDVDYDTTYNGGNNMYFLPRITAVRDGRGAQINYRYEPGGADGATGGGWVALPDGITGEYSNHLLEKSGPQVTLGTARTPKTIYTYYTAADYRKGLLWKETAQSGLTGDPGVVAQYDYDELRRLKTKTIDPGGKNITTEFYTCDGSVTQDVLVRDPDGYVTRKQFDTQGRLQYEDRFLSPVATIVDGTCPELTGAKYRTENVYDANGWLFQLKSDNKDQIGTSLNPATIFTQYDRYSNGWLKKKSVGVMSGTTATWSSQENYTYNWQGGAVDTTDASGRGTHKEYNGTGRLTSEAPIDKEGKTQTSLTVTYDWDPILRYETTVNPTGSKLIKVRDYAGRVTEEHSYPGASEISPADDKRITTHYVHDAAGNILRTYLTESDKNVDPAQNGRDLPVVSDVYQDYDEAGFNYRTRNRKLASDSASIITTSSQQFQWGDYGAPNSPCLKLTRTQHGDSYVADRVITTIYDSAGREWVTLDSEGGEVILTRDGRGNILAKDVKLEGKRAVTNMQYDAFGRVTKMIEPADHASKRHYRTSEYDSRGNLRRETLYEGLSTGTAGEGGSAKQTRVFEYDSAGRKVTSATLANSSATTITKYLDTVVDMTYHPDGRLQYQTEYLTIGTTATTRRTETQYDKLGRVWKIVGPGTPYLENVYADNGRLSQRKDFDGSKLVSTQFTYDGHGRTRIETQQSTPPLSSYRNFDTLGRTTYTEDRKGHIEATVYQDLLGLQVEVTREGEGVEAENQSNVTISQKTIYIHDLHGNLVEQKVENKASNGTAKDEQRTQYRYDSMGRLICAVLPDSSEAPSDTCVNCQKLEYDLAGQLKTTTEPRKSTVEAPQVTVLERDLRGQVIKARVNMDIDAEDEIEDTFEYDVFGTQTLAKHFQRFSPFQLVAQTARTVDAQGRVESETQTVGTGIGSDAGAHTVTYTHDESGQVTSVTYPSNKNVTVTPTLLGQVDDMKMDGQTLADYDYHGDGRLLKSRTTHTSEADTAYRTEWTYNENRQAEKIENNLDRSGASEQIVAYGFQYDENGNPKNRTTSGRPVFRPEEHQEYKLDGFDRLVRTGYKNSASGQETGSEQVKLDLAGNREKMADRTGTTTFYDSDSPSNQYSRVGSTDTGDPNLQYDSKGNLSVDEAGNHYVYDHLNHLVEVWSDPPNEATSSRRAAFLYDSYGRRVKTTIGSQTTHYYYNGASAIEEYSFNGTVETLRRYHVNGGQYVDEHVVSYEDDSGTGTFVPKYYLLDSNFSVAAVGNASGSRIEPVDVSPITGFNGVSRDFDGDTDVDGDDQNALAACWSGPDVAVTSNCATKDLDRDNDVDATDYVLFQACMSGDTVPAPLECTQAAPPSGSFAMHGLVVDAIPNGPTLLFARARHYNPKLGRWLQRDPMGYVDGGNLYAAFRGNPLAHMDPFGTWTEEGVIDAFASQYGDDEATLYAAIEILARYSLEQGTSLWSNDYSVDHKNRKIYIADDNCWTERSNENAAYQLYRVLAEDFYSVTNLPETWEGMGARIAGGGCKGIGGVFSMAGGTVLVLVPEPALTKVGGVGAIAFGANSAFEGTTQIFRREGGINLIGEGADAYQEWVTGEPLPEEWYLRSSTYTSMGGAAFELAGSGGFSKFLRTTPLRELPAATAESLKRGGEKLLSRLSRGKGSYAVKDVRSAWWQGETPVRYNPAMPRGREYMELSHTYISNNGRFGRFVPDIIKNRGWNLRPLWGSEHALVDPVRYKFMPTWWKAQNPLNSAPLRIWGRVPTSHKLIIGGSGAAATGAWLLDEGEDE